VHDNRFSHGVAMIAGSSINSQSRTTKANPLKKGIVAISCTDRHWRGKVRG